MEPRIARSPTAPTCTASIYPSLLEDVPTGDPASYRINRCSEIKQMFEREQEIRASLYKKYRKSVNATDGIDTFFGCVSFVCGTGGVGLLATGIAAPVGIGLGSCAVACNLLGVVTKFVGRRLAVKAKKHNDVRTLADSKLNTISDLVSTALIDGNISDTEFKLILDEVSKYHHMKARIRAQSKHLYASVAMRDDEKNTLILQGRNEARASLIKTLSAESSSTV